MALGTSISGFDGLASIGLHKNEEVETEAIYMGLSKSEGGDELQSIASDSNVYVSQHNKADTAVQKHEPLNDFAMFGFSL